jgi:DNA-binding NarL/FixJ family response regulator
MAAGRLILADDDVLLREGIASLLSNAGYEVAGQAGDGRELVELVREHRPDLVVVDIRMPPSNTSEGLEAARAIRSEFPEIGILLLSAHVEVEMAVDLLEEGERIGYLLKSRVMKAADFLDAVERIAHGGSVLDPSLVKALVGGGRRDDPLAELTPREREVLALMAEGRSNNGIAHRLYITEGAVEKHVRSILMKLRLPTTDDDHRRVLAVVTYLESR